MTERMSTGASWSSGDDYEPYVGRWSRLVAARFLQWIAVPAGRRWLDVGCGTGALAQAILTDTSPVGVVGVDPSPAYVQHAATHTADERSIFRVGDAQALPFEDDSFDVVVSGLVLNFVPDRPLALAEMQRVTKSGGTVAAYVWDYPGEMQLMKHFWDAAVELNPAAAASHEGVRFDFCRPEPLRSQFIEGGLRKVEVESLVVPTTFEGFDDYWRPFLGGQAPAPSYAMSLSGKDRDRLRESLRARLPVDTDGRIRLTARAWAVRGSVG